MPAPNNDNQGEVAAPVKKAYVPPHLRNRGAGAPKPARQSTSNPSPRYTMVFANSKELKFTGIDLQLIVPENSLDVMVPLIDLPVAAPHLILPIVDQQQVYITTSKSAFFELFFSFP